MKQSVLAAVRQFAFESGSEILNPGSFSVQLAEAVSELEWLYATLEEGKVDFRFIKQWMEHKGFSESVVEEVYSAMDDGDHGWCNPVPILKWRHFRCPLH